MPDVSFFNNFGLVGVRDFLTLEDCQNLRNEIAEASISPATIREEGSEYGIDEGKRKTRWAEVSAEASRLVVDRMTQLLPEVSQRLDVETPANTPSTAGMPYMARRRSGSKTSWYRSSCELSFA